MENDVHVVYKYRKERIKGSIIAEFKRYRKTCIVQKWHLEDVML